MFKFFKKKPAQSKLLTSSSAASAAAEVSLGAKMLSAVVADSIVAIAITDLDGKHIYVNSSWEKMWGYSLKESVGMTIPQMIAGEELPRLTKEILPSIIEKGSWIGECWVLRKDGTKFLVSMSASLIKDDKGKPVGMTASFIDITDQKKAEEEEREIQNEYKILYESSRDAITIMKPPEWKFTSGNPAAIKMFNCKDEKEFTSLGPWQLSPEKQPDGQSSLDKSKKLIMEAMKQGSSFSEWTHKRYKGEDFPATVLLSRVKDGEIYIQATVRDISAQKRAEKEIVRFSTAARENLSYIVPILQKISVGDFSESIKIPKKEDEFTDLLVALKLMLNNLRKTKKEIDKREQNLENAKIATRNILHDLQAEKEERDDAKAKQDALLESIGDGIIATDSDRKIIIMNKKAEVLLGWKIDEALGKLYDDVILLEDEKGTFVPPEEKPLHKAFDSHITTAITPTTTTTTTTTPNPPPSPTTTATVELYLVSKNKIKFPVAITVSPVVLNNKIIGAVEVFRDITKEKEIDKTKTEFVSLASHQLRTPLASISWLTEMFLRGDFGRITAKQKESIEVANASALRMAKLISSLLNVSRLELGTFAVNSKPTIVRQVINETLTELKPQAKEKKIKIVKDYSIKPLAINADPVILKIIYQNLLSNAVRYALPKTTITVKICKDEKNFLVAVSDQGIGIPKAEQSQIFSKLFRASNAQVMQTDGNGLGLYMVKSIVGQAGGQVWFDSAINKGTTFYVSLPLEGMKNKEGNKFLEANKLDIKEV